MAIVRPYTNRIFGLIIFFVLALGILSAGCAKSGKEETNRPRRAPRTETSEQQPPSPTDTPIPAPTATPTPLPEVIEEEALLKDIWSAKDFIEWYSLKEKQKAKGRLSSRVVITFRDKAEEMIRFSPAVPVNECLDLIFFRWKLEEKLEEGRGNYRVSWLFKVKKPIEQKAGQELSLLLEAKVPQEDKEKIHSSDSTLKDGAIEIQPNLDPPPAEWKAEEYHLVEWTLAVPIVSYDFRMAFTIAENGASKGPWGKRLILGRFLDEGKK
jgi:hypothetical protein